MNGKLRTDVTREFIQEKIKAIFSSDDVTDIAEGAVVPFDHER